MDIHYAPYGLQPHQTAYECGAPRTEPIAFYPGAVTCVACKRLSPGLWLEAVLGPTEAVRVSLLVCQICGKSYPDRYLFDLKGNVPGGAKVTCLECCGRLEEREACANVAKAVGESLVADPARNKFSQGSAGAFEVERAIRARKDAP